MKYYYQVYDDQKKERPTNSVICIFSDVEPPLRNPKLSIEQLMHHYHCLASDKQVGEPVITVCPLVYLLVWCCAITEEQAEELDSTLVRLLKITTRT